MVAALLRHAATDYLAFVVQKAGAVRARARRAPFLPLAIFCDGLVWCLRSDRVDELRALVVGLDDGHRSEAGAVKKAGRNVMFLIGAPA